jgi:uncharacterized Zn-finger protein
VVLQTHMVRHTGEKPHLCTFCPASFSQKGNLHSHVQRVHSEVNNQLTPSPCTSMLPLSLISRLGWNSCYFHRSDPPKLSASVYR